MTDRKILSLNHYRELRTHKGMLLKELTLAVRELQEELDMVVQQLSLLEDRLDLHEKLVVERLEELLKKVNSVSE